MRIWGADIPPGYLRWSATGAGVVVLGILIAAALSTIGLFGTSPEDQPTKIQATVVTSAPCNRPGATETVKFTLNNRPHQAKLDGCGHTKNEKIEVEIPTTPLPPNLVVHASNAAIGDQEAGEGLARLLIVVSGMAGASYAFLIRRGPKTKKLPKPLRLT